MLEDFTVEEVEKLHQLYGTPLTDKELMDFYELVGGHPYLVNHSLYMLSSGSTIDVQKKIRERYG